MTQWIAFGLMDHNLTALQHMYLKGQLQNSLTAFNSQDSRAVLLSAISVLCTASQFSL